jgi:hypothetical protein
MLKQVVHIVTTGLSEVKQNKTDFKVTGHEAKKEKLNMRVERYEATAACIVPQNVALGNSHPNTARSKRGPPSQSYLAHSNPTYTCKRGCLSKRCNRVRYSPWHKFVCEYHGIDRAGE